MICLMWNLSQKSYDGTIPEFQNLLGWGAWHALYVFVLYFVTILHIKTTYTYIFDIISIQFVLLGHSPGLGHKGILSILCYIYCFIFVILIAQWLLKQFTVLIMAFMVHVCIHANHYNDFAWESWSHYWPFMRGIQMWPGDFPHKGPMMQKLFLC